MRGPLARPLRSLLAVSFVVVTGLVALASCGTTSERPAVESSGENVATRRLVELRRSRDYFALDSLLAASPGLDSPVVGLIRAETAQAFNRLEPSNAILQDLEAPTAGLSDSLRVRLHRARYRNHMRLHDYPRALESARTLLATTEPDSALRFDVENDVRFLEAVRDVPPQRVVRRGASVVRRRPDTRVPVRIADSTRGYVLDTGANLSAMMRSEAEALGLEIREAGIVLGSVTGQRLTGDIAVAERLTIGEVELAHVLFIVLPDEVLTFQDGAFTIPGIVGFPVFEALGEIAFRGGEALAIPAEVPVRAKRNLALDFLTPLIRVGVFGDRVVCQLDSGASHTTFYRPLYVDHGERIRAIGRADTVTSTGVGGSRRIPARVLPEVQLALGDTVAVVRDRPVFTEAVVFGEEAAEPDDEFLACNVGLDVLRSFDEYVVNFRSMTFLLR